MVLLIKSATHVTSVFVTYHVSVLFLTYYVRNCTPKQIDLTSVFVTCRCKSARAQCRKGDVNPHIIWCLHKVFQENKLRL